MDNKSGKIAFLHAEDSQLCKMSLAYSMDSIIRPGRSRLLGFEKKDSTGCLLETFSKNLDQDD